MLAPVQVNTPRLRLRRPEMADIPVIFASYASDPEVTRYLAWPCHRTLADTQAFFEYSEQEWQRVPAGPYLIERRDGFEVIGGTGLEWQSDTLASTGYLLARQHWGQGYATEALRAIVQLAPRLGLRQLQAHCHPEHNASVRVLEKCGFRRSAGATLSSVFPNLDPTLPVPAYLYQREC